MPINQEDNIERIIKRMDLIIRLMLKNQQSKNEGKITQKDQILELYNFGISTQDVANILGTSRNTIDVALSGLRKAGKISTKIMSEAKTESGGETTPSKVEAQHPESIVEKK